MHLRCTLMDFERNYQVKILPKQINKVIYYNSLAVNASSTKFILIVLFILIGEIFLMQNVNSFLGFWVSSFNIYPVLLCAFIPIKRYSNAEADKAKIIKENKNKSGIYKL